MSKYPDLPIISVEPPRRETQKYGSFFYLALAGLVVLILLVTWFVVGLWSNRSVWSEVYRLYDRRQSEAERVNAARKLALDPKVSQADRLRMGQDPALPEPARYLMLENLDSEVLEGNARGYGRAVASWSGGPEWTWPLVVRPLALAALEGSRLSEDSLKTLADAKDPFVRGWADFALAVSSRGSDTDAIERLKAAADSGTDVAPFAAALLDASKAELGADRRRGFDRATEALRQRHPAVGPFRAILEAVRD